MSLDPYADLATNIRMELSASTPLLSAGERSLTVERLAAVLIKAGQPVLAMAVLT
jgi:hypothetical protein